MQKKMDENQEYPETNARISLFQIDRLLLGELPLQEAEALKKSIAADINLAAYYQRAQERTQVATQFKLKSVPLTYSEKILKYLSQWALRLALTCRQKWAKVSSFSPNSKGLAWAMVLIIASALTYWNVLMQAPENQKTTQIQVKGNSSTDIFLELNKQSYAHGADIPVHTGDTLKILYRSTTPIYLQVWNQEGDLKPQLISQTNIEPYIALLHSQYTGRSLVIDSGNNSQKVIVIWAQIHNELNQLSQDFVLGKSIPENKQIQFNIHTIAPR